MPFGEELTIEGRKKKYEILRDFMWILFIPKIPNIPDGFKPTSDHLEIACKSTSIPSQIIDTHTSSFFGQKQIFPLNKGFTNEFSCTFEESEELTILKLFTMWMQSICSSDPKDVNSTVSNFITKKQYAVDVWLKLYKYNGKQCSHSIRYHNAFPTRVDESSIQYDGNGSVKINVAFAYDYFDLEKKMI